MMMMMMMAHTLSNDIFCFVQAERRLSKVDTLKLAISYISYLSDMVQTCDDLNNKNNANQRGQKTQDKVIVRCHITGNFQITS
jgi:hypothetical protein